MDKSLDAQADAFAQLLALSPNDIDAAFRSAAGAGAGSLPASDRGRRVSARPEARHPRRRHGPRQDAPGDRRPAARRAERALSGRLPGLGEAQLGARDPHRRARRVHAHHRTRRGGSGATRVGDHQLRHPVEAHGHARPRAVGGARLRRGALPEEPHERAQPARAAARGHGPQKRCEIASGRSRRPVRSCIS